MKKIAFILFTGDRVDYLKYTINSCEEFIKKTKIDNYSIDIFLLSFFDDLKIDEYKIKNIKLTKPSEEDSLNLPMTNQISNYSNINDRIRINFGMYILFKEVPNKIFMNFEIFKEYDYILKCRSDLIFETKDFIYDDSKIYTFECFWGGCRYNKKYTNDHFIFGKSEEVLDIISYDLEYEKLSNFWNPEEFMTHLYGDYNFNKVELTTDKYYLLSKDRESRKFIGYPMETINQNDVYFLNKIGIDVNKIKFTNKYDF